MVYDTGEKHLKEINHVSILESIDEVFDGATSMLTENAVMYGSTVTALLAGLPIVGDLDVAVSNQEYMRLCQEFANSVKWLQVDGNTIQETQPQKRMGYVPKSPLAGPTKKFKNPYEEGADHLPIDALVAFENVMGGRVQIVQSKAMTGDMLEDAVEVVRKVDFTFCGMAVDRWGRVLETIPHAYSDCLARLIRIQDYQPRLDPKRLKQRIRKYTLRGWSLTFSIDQAMLNLRNAKKAEMMKPKKKAKKKKPSSCFRIKKDSKKGLVIEAKRDFLRVIGSGSKVREVTRHYATDLFGVRVASNTNKMGGLDFWQSKDSPENLTPKLAKKIIAELDSYFMARYDKSLEKFRQQEKKKRIAEMYGSSKGYTTKGWVTTSTSTSTNSW